MKRSYLRKHSNSRSVMYDHKKSILQEKLEKSQNLEKPQHSSGYNQSSASMLPKRRVQDDHLANYDSMKTSVNQSPDKPAIIHNSLARREPHGVQPFVSKIPRLTRSIDRESPEKGRHYDKKEAKKQVSPIKVYERSLLGTRKSSPS